jgi:putative membrane protein
MYAIRTFIRTIIHFLVLWAVNGLALLVTDWLLPGIQINAIDPFPRWAVAMGAAFILGLVNLIIRPLILLLAVPLGFIVLFVVGFFVNAVMLRITANLMDGGLLVDGWLPAIVGGIVLSSVGAIISGLLASTMPTPSTRASFSDAWRGSAQRCRRTPPPAW